MYLYNSGLIGDIVCSSVGCGMEFMEYQRILRCTEVCFIHET